MTETQRTAMDVKEIALLWKRDSHVQAEFITTLEASLLPLSARQPAEMGKFLEAKLVTMEAITVLDAILDVQMLLQDMSVLLLLLELHLYVQLNVETVSFLLLKPVMTEEL